MTTWREKADAIHRALIGAREPYGLEDRRFLALALAGEVGEFANLVKKEWRGDYDVDTPRLAGRKFGVDAAGEIADIRIYLELVALCFDIDVDEACEAKTVELLERWPQVRPAVEALTAD